MLGGALVPHPSHHISSSKKLILIFFFQLPSKEEAAGCTPLNLCQVRLSVKLYRYEDTEINFQFSLLLVPL
jgi:hypothetical protein